MADSKYEPKAEKMAESGAQDRVKSPVEYIQEMRGFLKCGERKQAFAIMLHANLLYPDHPIILSYFGWLQALVDRKYHSAVTACKRAFIGFKPADRHNASTIYPILYLNLGRACVAAGKKKEAVDSFAKGLKYDPYHVELKKEMQLLGIRKKAFLPFLSRSNPLNKVVGILRSRSA